MPFDDQSFLTQQEPREGAIMTSSILSYVWKNIGLTEKYLGGGEYSERHAEHFQRNLRFAQMAFEAGLNAFRGGDFDRWKDLIGPQQPTTAEHFLAAELWNQDGPSRRSGRPGRLEKRLILAPLDIGFRVLRYRNSAAIPSIAYQNRMRQAAELSAYMTRHQGNRNIEEITVYLFDRPICLGEDLAGMTTRARADLSKVIRQLNKEYADKSCEIVFLREEDVLHPADNDVFVHVHLIAHMSKKSWIKNRFYRDFHMLWNYPVSGRIVRDVDALSCYLTKSVVIPEGTPPMFLRWFLLARHGSHSMARFGCFRTWYRNVICRHRGRVIRHNDGFRILVRCRDDKVDTADSLVIEDLEAATDVLTEACEGVEIVEVVEVVDEAKIRAQPDTGCSTSPDNIICGITAPRSEPGDERHSYIMVQNPNPSSFRESDGDSWAEVMHYSSRAHDAYRNNTGREFDLREYIAPRARAIYNRYTHSCKIYRDTITLSKRALAIVLECLDIDLLNFQDPNVRQLTTSDPPF